jgi:hypothetical protein
LVRDDVDYDGDGKKEGVNETIPGYSKSYAVEYKSSLKKYLFPPRVLRDTTMLNTLMAKLSISSADVINYVKPIATNYYLVRDDVDYDLDGRKEGCNETIPGASKSYCIQYLSSSKRYVLPSYVPNNTVLNNILADLGITIQNTINYFGSPYYVLRNDIDYDGDGRIEGCNENVLNLNKSYCILYDTTYKKYIAPASTQTRKRA